MKMWKQVACNLKRNKTGANFKEHRKPSEAFSPSVKIRHEPVCSVAEVGNHTVVPKASTPQGYKYKI